MAIDSFSGVNRFLSNFNPAVVWLDGEEYPTVEHAYQAAKTLNPIERKMIRGAKTPGDSKRLGRRCSKRDDWEIIKLTVMRNLLVQKFAHIHLRQKLLATNDEELIEGNTWGDVYWGVCKGVGQNWLGKLLMAIREEIKK